MAEKKEVLERVGHILRAYPQTRDNDRILISKYLAMYHNCYSFHEYANKPHAPALETITRCRRKIQAQGVCPATPSVKEVRSEQERQHREFARGR